MVTAMSNRHVIWRIHVVWVLVFVPISVWAQAQKRVTVALKDLPMETAVHMIMERFGSDYQSFADPDVLQHIYCRSLVLRDVSLQDVGKILDSVLRPYGLAVFTETRTLLIKKMGSGLPSPDPGPAADTLPGVQFFVTDPEGYPLQGATILGPPEGGRALSAIDGSATLKRVHLPATFTITYVGARPVVMTVLTGGRVNVVMAQLPGPLEESVVTGYAIGKRRYLPGNRYKVDTNVLKDQPVSDIIGALSGLVPGLVITQTSGTYGASFKIELRGPNSIFNGKDPLIIIDGVPFAPNNKSLSQIPSGSAAGSLSPFSFVCLSDIESVEVLKDADATAIYGSRGANGVIIITTKTGRRQKPQVDVQVFTGFSRTTRRPDLLNSRQYARLRTDALRYDHKAVDKTNAAELVSWDTLHTTDWGKYLIGGTGRVSSVNVSLSGGNQYIQFRTAGSYRHERNIFPGQPVHVLGSLHASMVNASRDSLLHMQTTLLLSRDWNNQFINDPTSFQFLAPNAPGLVDPAGNLVFKWKDVYMNNPLSYTKDAYRALSGNFLISHLLSYQFWRLLVFRINLGYNSVYTEESSQIPISAQDPGAIIPPSGSSFLGNIKFSSWIAEPQLEFRDTLGYWKLGLLFGNSWQGQRNTGSTLSATGFTSDALLHVPSAAADVSVDAHALDYHYSALFFRLNINAKDRYIVNFTGRRDGSSRFGPGYQWGNFGAIGAAWLFHREKIFHAALPFLSFGKLRASYGVTGNDQIGDFRFLPSFATTTTIPYQGIPGIYPNGVANPDLHWETIRKLEGAVELGACKDRVLLNVAWFRNRSSSQILPYFIPVQTGFESEFRNSAAVIQNKGWEFSATTTNLKGKELQWTTVFNFSTLQNKLVSFPGQTDSSYTKDLIVGQSINVLKAYLSLGVDPHSGLFIFKDINNDGNIDKEDRVAAGSRDVRSFGNITNIFQIGPWRFISNIEIRIQSGTDYRTDLYGLHPPGMAGPGQYGNWTTAIEDRWRKEGDRARYQVVSTSKSSDATKQILNFVGSSAMLADNSFARLKNIALSYAVPAKYLEKMGMTEGCLFINAENLFTITKYPGVDPEIHSALVLPPRVTVTAGFRITFK